MVRTELGKTGVRLFASILFGCGAAHAHTDSRGGPPERTFSMQVVVEGLQDPDGLAFHPATRELYVSEETPGRISVIRGGRAQPVLGPQIRVGGPLPEAIVTEAKPESFWRSPILRNPEGICFTPDATLYVVEDLPGGRVLAFAPDAQGRYESAVVVPVPSLGDAEYAWESIATDADGQIYLAGSSHQGGAGWGASCVLVRDAAQEWWMIDYSPLASFSAVALAADENILLVGDEAVGGLTWWDLDRKIEIQTLNKEIGSLEGAAFLPDGSVAVAQERGSRPASGGAANGRLLHVDPSSGSYAIVAEGMGTLESVVCDERSGRLYATEDETGRILSFTPDRPFGPNQKLLDVTRRSGEARRGLPPRNPPDFLKHFMKKVGVELVDQDAAGRAAGVTAAALSASGIPPLTLEELGRRVPLVAGRIKVEELEGVADPVTEVSFINLFPNQIVSSDKRLAPGICLYAARHRSGRVERSQILEGLHARKLSFDGPSERLGPNALLMLPLTTCTAVENDNGVTVSMTFLGLERMADSFLTLNYGRKNEAFFSVASATLRVARATFSETRADGGEIFNFAMTGVRPRRAEDAVWLRLSTSPQWSLLSPAVEPWVSRWALHNMPELVARMRRFNKEQIERLIAMDRTEEKGPVVRRGSEQAQPRGDRAPAVSEAPAEGEPDRAEAPPRMDPPLADIQIAPRPMSEEDRLVTNLILNRIVAAWSSGTVP